MQILGCRVLACIGGVCVVEADSCPFSCCTSIENRLTLSLNTIFVAVRHFYGKLDGLNGYIDRQKITMVIFVVDKLMRF